MAEHKKAIYHSIFVKKENIFASTKFAEVQRLKS